MRPADGAGDAAESHDRNGVPTGDEMPALVALLHAERSALAVAVALASGATTYGERTRLERLGGNLVLLCAALRERLDLAGRAAPSGAGPEADVMLATTSYDARLAALADFLDATAARATAALTTSTDDEFTRTLRDLIADHARAAEWLRERAAAFAATRPLDRVPNADAERSEAAGEDAPASPGASTRDGEPAPGSP